MLPQTKILRPLFVGRAFNHSLKQPIHEPKLSPLSSDEPKIQGVSCEIFTPTFSPLLVRVSTEDEPN
jgi:hypothetical protein